MSALEDAAVQRRARLARLREDAKDAKDEGDKPVLKLRNYQPQSELDVVTADAPLQQPLQLAEKEKEALQDDPEATLDAVDFSTLAPRKPTWDLDRDLEKKMAKLERRTDRAIAELVASRLKEAGDGEIAMDQLVAAGMQAEALDAQISDDDM